MANRDPLDTPFDEPRPRAATAHRDVIDAVDGAFVERAPGDEDGDDAQEPKLSREWSFTEAMWQMLKDPKAEWFSKGIAIAALLYLINPFDLVPEFIPVFGLSDDLAALLTAVVTLIAAVRRYAAENTETRPDGTVQLTGSARGVALTVLTAILFVLAGAVVLVVRWATKGG